MESTTESFKINSGVTLPCSIKIYEEMTINRINLEFLYVITGIGVYE